MTRIRRNDGITLDDSHDFNQGEGHSISESLEVIAVELVQLNNLIREIAESRGELER